MLYSYNKTRGKKCSEIHKENAVLEILCISGLVQFRPMFKG